MMTRRLFSLQSLLLALCIIMLVLIGYKGIEISAKIASFKEAERLYAEKDLVSAETWYLKTRDNRSILYHEDEVAARLEELAPITKMKLQLDFYDSEGAKAVADGQFDRLLEIYAELSKFRNTYYTGDGPYSVYYREISQAIGVSEHFVSYFTQFKNQFYAEMNSNLENQNYDDESFKWKLLKIPEIFYGDQEKQISELIAAYEDYDLKKYDALATNGLYDRLLTDAEAVLSAYSNNDLKAPWVASKVEELMGALVRQELENNNYSSFARHAKQYNTFAAKVNPKSSLAAYVEGQIAKLMKQAKSLSRDGAYQEAIDLYTSLNPYQDTSEAVSQVQLAWMAAEPVLLLPQLEGDKQYTHVTGGTKSYNAQIYVVAADDENRVYFGKMNDQSNIQVLTNTDLMSGNSIQSLSIDPTLSTRQNPVIKVTAESLNRNALYALFEVSESSIELILWVEADDLETNSDGSLLVDNPYGSAGEGQVSIYERIDSYYQFTGVKKFIRDVTADQVAQYPNDMIRLLCTVTQPGFLETLAYADDTDIVLKGNFDFSEGDAVITGTFLQYTDIIVRGEWISVPVIQVETYEPK
ncbi:hypothetical protein KQJ23_02250 [Paenibacillus sp. MSJ-6]|uniref:SbsC C-terminal domain-containing protein n=2 Tax=Paenibacillus brevis TaxID=2841508 RepID=A0ABS6FKD5_9BACL|nr:hypothetical protein [Paenibacillus brevis]